MAASRRQPRTRRQRASAPRAWSWILGVGVALAVLALGTAVWTRSGQGQAALLNLGAQGLYGEVQARLGDALAGALPGFRPGPLPAQRAPDAHDWALPEAGPTARIRCRVVAVQDAAPWWQVQASLAAAVAAAGGEVLWGERLPRGGGGAGPDEQQDLLRLDVGVGQRPTHTLVLYRGGTERPLVRWGGDPAGSAWQALQGAVGSGPVIALVLDDWGYRRDETTAGLLALEVPLTLAVLPGLTYSRAFALEATDLALPPRSGPSPPAGGQATAADASAADARRAAGCPVSLGIGPAQADLAARRREVLLHLPMQPQGYPEVDPGPDPLLVGMTRERIGELLDRALALLPHVRGVNNHMGSAATADVATMDALMAELRERDLIFLDSLTSSASVAHERALAAGVPAVSNRIFLDADHRDPQRIRERLQRLAAAARSTGSAVGIGHPHPATLAVLQAELPRLQASGVHLVTLSELLALRAGRTTASR